MKKPKYRRNNEVCLRAIHTVSLVQNSSAVEIKSEKVIFSLPDPDKIFVFQRTTVRLNTSLTGTFSDEKKIHDTKMRPGFTLVYHLQTSWVY